MPESLPQVYFARHGETAWSLTGQHTGLTDLPLTARGQRNAKRLGERLVGVIFDQVFTSPLIRTRRTCELAGFQAAAEIGPDLVEWNYGDYDGKTTAEIRAARPDWELFRDGCPNGESVAEIGRRADREVERLRKLKGRTLLFSSGHFLRVLAARWCELDPWFAKYLYLDTAALSIAGYEHNLNSPVIRLWNDCRHVRD